MSVLPQFAWVATAVHFDGSQFEVTLVQEDMPLLEEFAVAMLGHIQQLSLRPRRGGRRARSRLRALRDYGYAIDGIRLTWSTHGAQASASA